MHSYAFEMNQCFSLIKKKKKTSTREEKKRSREPWWSSSKRKWKCDCENVVRTKSLKINWTEGNYADWISWKSIYFMVSGFPPLHTHWVHVCMVACFFLFQFVSFHSFSTSNFVSHTQISSTLVWCDCNWNCCVSCYTFHIINYDIRIWFRVCKCSKRVKYYRYENGWAH